MSTRIRYYLQLGLAWLLVVLGTLILFSPFPLGLFTLAVGLSLLIYTSESFQHKVHDYRQSHHRFNQQIVRLEDQLERYLRVMSDTLRKTRPQTLDE
ncbi:hypothetical protein FHR99_003013 [Litorivivens lipolytica]|uniref:Uncharacterized protein n=1 Tax=Litorivivens lipolytica TaxID=1524264 RepID=A0A7W4Z6P8_9GAMM|nr:hypothetical protein [Litorivivens lipolytica]MBB3048739.1 hypothetical protein [Litorivivens lipolytica]